MSDTDDGFDEAFKGFGDDPAPVTPPADDKKEEPTPPAPPAPKVEEPKKDEDKKPEAPETPPAPSDDKKPQEGAQPPKAPETPPEAPETPEAPQPLTKDDVTSVIKDVINNERMSSKELETATKEVLESYYPEGLSNVLVDQTTGKELRTPQDVVDVTDGKLTTEQAAQWLMNEQFKLDQQVANIKNQAKEIAETTTNFKRDGIVVLEKYQPLFDGLKEKYPNLQDKVFKTLMKQVKVDRDKGVILSAPDVIEFYDDFLAPYKETFEASTQTPATNPTPNPNEPPKPTAEDRMDVSGDGSSTGEVNDPNDFAQQVKKELAKGI